MDLSSFLTSLATSFIIFIILMLLFAWLSGKPGNSVVYYPNRILKGLDPGSKTRNPFTWISEAMSSTEKDILSVSGVDTAVYFVFLATGLYLSFRFYYFHVLYYFFLIGKNSINYKDLILKSIVKNTTTFLIRDCRSNYSLF